MDTREDVFNILCKTGISVEYRYPETLLDNNFPKICYYISDITDSDYADNKATSCVSEATIQIYTKQVNGKIKEIHHEVMSLLKENGYKKIFFDDYYDAEDKYTIYTLRYSKKFLYKGDVK